MSDDEAKRRELTLKLKNELPEGMDELQFFQAMSYLSLEDLENLVNMQERK